MLEQLGGDRPRDELYEQSERGKDPTRVKSGLKAYGTVPLWPFNLRDTNFCEIEAHVTIRM